MSKAPPPETEAAETPDGTKQGFGIAPHERPVPHISIQAFCEFPDTGATLQRAAEDRRLSKAHVTVQLGGIPAAIQYFTNNSTPNLLIAETKSQGETVLRELEQLAEVCDETTRVMVVGRVNDVQLYRELARRGVSEYLVAPFNPLQIIESISNLYVDPYARPLGRVVSFIAARGGAGSSTIAHNVAWTIADGLGIDTAIVDFDLPFGTAGLDFNQDPEQGAADALASPERLDDVLLDRLLVKCGDRLSLLAAPAMLDRDYASNVNAFETVIDQVRGSMPSVIIDIPHSWTPAVRHVLLGADEIVIVATPDLASLRNVKNMMDVFKTHRKNDSPPRLVLNQSGVPKRPEISVKEFGDAVGVEPTLVLPFEPQLFGVAANNGQMLAEVQPNSRTAAAMRQLAEVLTGRTVNANAKKNGLTFLPFLVNRKAG